MLGLRVEGHVKAVDAGSIILVVHSWNIQAMFIWSESGVALRLHFCLFSQIYDRVYVGFSAPCWCYISCEMMILPPGKSLQGQTHLSTFFKLCFGSVSWYTTSTSSLKAARAFPQAIAALRFGLLCNQITILVPVSAENCGFLAPMQTYVSACTGARPP